jgi:hypothetical protein
MLVTLKNLVLNMLKSKSRMLFIALITFSFLLITGIYQSNRLSGLYDNSFNGNTVKPFELYVYLGNLQISTIISVLAMINLIFLIFICSKSK